MTKLELAKAEQIQTTLMLFECSASLLDSEITELAKLATNELRNELERLRGALNCVLTRLASNEKCFK